MDLIGVAYVAVSVSDSRYINGMRLFCILYVGFLKAAVPHLLPCMLRDFSGTSSAIAYHTWPNELIFRHAAT